MRVMERIKQRIELGFWKYRFSLEIKVPPGIEIIHMKNKVRFRGDSSAIDKFAQEFYRVADLNDGDLCRLDKYILKVSGYITKDSFKPNWIELPNHAWKVMGSKFREVSARYEENPFDFGDCGLISRSELPFDIGVEVTDLPSL